MTFCIFTTQVVDLPNQQITIAQYFAPCVRCCWLLMDSLILLVCHSPRSLGSPSLCSPPTIRISSDIYKNSLICTFGSRLACDSLPLSALANIRCPVMRMGFFSIWLGHLKETHRLCPCWVCN